MDEKWFVYIVECRTKDLYVGVAKNVKQRIDLRNKGRACRYTKFRGPVRLKYSEVHENYGLARKRERQVKKYSRVKKLALVGEY
ncbi:MAG: GIY-YIG nuclease family protein [Candidatus Omnitrophica bacterium]|nr:GIY-YIG nuclease family protein [Candidatus Omnitrophota bacterium]